MAGEILGEGSHQTTVGEKLLGWGSSLGEMAMILLCALLVSLGIRWFIEKVWKKKLPGLLQLPGMLFFVYLSAQRQDGKAVL